MKLILVTAIIAVLQIIETKGNIFYVDNKGAVELEANGSFEAPFRTISECVKKLNNPGDECQIRSGTYHEEVSINGLKGSKTSPIVIRGYADERPKLDGTVPVELLSTEGPGSKWTIWKEGIYRAQITEDIWQLFVDGKMMINARWPNAQWEDDKLDKSIFDGTRWPGMTEDSRAGADALIDTKDDMLKNLNLNVTDAIAILNVGSFNTFVAKVENHVAKSNKFTFQDTFGKYHFKPKRSRYFLEDKLNLLDAPREWFYDKISKYLYIWVPEGKDPSNCELRGKVQSYALTIENSQHILIKNLDFFATTLKAESLSSTNHVDDIRIDSNNFKFHSYSKRMLGDIGLIKWTKLFTNDKDKKMKNLGTLSIFNNTFYGSDGVALAFTAKNSKLANNLFENNDWTGANMLIGGGGMATVFSVGINNRFERNTLRYNGASVGLRPFLQATVRLNDISKQCWGLIQNDGAGIQVTVKPQKDVKLEQNWVHDSPKYGLRFDGEPPKIGSNGSMTYNVVGRCNGMMIKGDYHKADHNLAFEKRNAGDSDGQGGGCAFCVLKYVRKNPGLINQHSTVTNNVADVANGGKIITGRKPVKYYPVQGSTIDNNVFDVKVGKEYEDPDINDFRPLESSNAHTTGAGPYTFEPIYHNYWMPGRIQYKAGNPIPPHQSTNVKAKNRDVLMFLGGDMCLTHRIFFGTGEDQVKNAEKGSALDIGTTENGDNVKYLPSNVWQDMKKNKGTEYFWRVDAICPNSVIYRGDVWSFKTLM